MNFKSLKDAKNMIENSRKIGGLTKRYAEIIDQDRCDKYGMRFGGDSRFSVFNVSIFLDCHTGYFGNSNCSTLINIDQKLAQSALNAYLNKNMDNVLQEMSKYMAEEAGKITDIARAELEAATEFLDDVDAIGREDEKEAENEAENEAESVDPEKIKVGDKVHYQYKHDKDGNDYENGMVKYASKAADAGYVWVVYKCNNDWDRFQEYTGIKTSVVDLKAGWKGESK